jgi:hypothetical protein
MESMKYIQEVGETALGFFFLIGDIIAVNLNNEYLTKVLCTECGDYRNWNLSEEM